MYCAFGWRNVNVAFERAPVTCRSETRGYAILFYYLWMDDVELVGFRVSSWIDSSFI